MSLDTVFDELDVIADPFALCELQGRCTLGLDSQAAATLHYILAGEGELLLPGHAPIRLDPGTLALVPTMQPHRLRSFGAPGHPIPECHPAELDLASHLIVGEQRHDTERLLAICSRLKVGIRGTDGLINLVREPLVQQISPESTPSPMPAILREISSPKLGSRAMIRVLLLQCVIELLRERLLDPDSRLNWLAAVSDERLWRALRLMLERPGDPHTVESLAAVSGMSRSAFAARFAGVYGNGPMELLRDLRVQRAAAMLSRSDLPVKRIAQLVGFQSRSAFSRTFTAATGVPPHRYRVQSQN